MIKRKARSVPIYQGHNFMFVSKDMGNVDYLRTCGVVCSCTCVWYMHVCACVHACVQRPEKDAPHPFLPFNKSLTELGTPFFFFQLGWLARKTVILQSCPFPSPQHWCCGPVWLWLCHFLCGCWDPDSTLRACTTGPLPCELSPQRLKVGLDRTEVTGGLRFV